MRFSKRTIFATATPIVITAGAALAYSVVSGTGVGVSTASNRKAQFTTSVTVPQSLDIGGSGDVAVTVKNTGTAAEKVRSLQIGKPVVVTPQGQTCPDGSFVADITPTKLPSTTLAPGDDFVAASGKLTFVNLDGDNQDGCAGAKVTISVTASSQPTS